MPSRRRGCGPATARAGCRRTWPRRCRARRCPTSTRRGSTRPSSTERVSRCPVRFRPVRFRPASSRPVSSRRRSRCRGSTPPDSRCRARPRRVSPCRGSVSDPWVKGDYDLAFDGWSVNPDPDYVLSIHTCGTLPATPKDSGATDNFICDKEFDTLYAQQAVEYDAAKRADLVKRMQSRLYDTGYMNIMAYPNALEAYRTDQIKSITTMPEAAGNLWGQDGYWSWWSAVPTASAASSGDSDDSSSAGLIIGIGAAAIILVGVGVWTARRRRTTADDRE
ncbi:hypothetical protein SNARM312S_06472 [Streptomyces narbonensis]